jgi:hypothetical protein
MGREARRQKAKTWEAKICAVESGLHRISFLVLFLPSSLLVTIALAFPVLWRFTNHWLEFALERVRKIR